MNFLKEASELKEEIIANRRYLHENAEVGSELYKTTAFIKTKLTEYGCAFEVPIPCAVVCNIGDKSKKTILFRADTDALPHEELSGEPFACKTGASHSCGHDIHTACLLACAKMLKKHENELNGNVKLVFQPDEEQMHGAVDLIAAGVLENPHVDCAVSMHTNLPLKAGAFNVLGGTYLSSNDMFEINVHGVGSHSSQPDKGIDPILVAAKIVDAVQTVTTREIDPLSANIITFGSIHSGNAANIIPDSAVLRGTIRAFDREQCQKVKQRFSDIVNGIAATYRATADIDFFASTPTTYNDPALTQEILTYLKELVGEEYVYSKNLKVKGSDDFAYYSEKVPGCMYHVGMGTLEEGYTYGLHNPHVRFNESSLVNGAAAFASIAYQWLKKH